MLYEHKRVFHIKNVLIPTNPKEAMLLQGSHYWDTEREGEAEVGRASRRGGVGGSGSTNFATEGSQ